MLNDLLSSIRDSLSSWFLDPVSSSSLHKYLDTYTVLFSLLILCGCTVNILVIAAYKLGHRKRLLSSNGLVPYNHMHAAFNLNFASPVRHNNNSPAKLKSGMTKNDMTISFDKSSSVVHASLKKTTQNQAVLYKRHSIHQAGYDLRRSLRQSTNSLMYMSHDHLTVNKIRHTLCSYFILSLGYCDLFICCLIMPMSLVMQSDYFQQYMSDFISSEYIYADLMCQLSFYLVQIPLVLEIEILLTIAIDRYSSVFNPIKIYFFDRNKSKLTLIAQILLSFILSLPNLLFYTSSLSSKKVYLIQSNSSLVAANSNNSNNNSNNTRTLLYSLSNYCEVREEYYDLYSYYQFVLLFLFLLNLVTISVFYLKVYCHIYKVSRDQRVEQISQHKSSIATNASVKSQNQDLVMFGNLNKFMGKFVAKPKQKRRALSDPDQNADFTPALNNIEENAFEAEFNETNETNHFIISNLDASPKRENKDRQNRLSPLKPLLLLKRSQSCPTLFLNPGKKKVSIASSVTMCDHNLKNAVDLKCTKRSSNQARPQKIALKYINDSVIFDPTKRSSDQVDPNLVRSKRSSIRNLLKPSNLVELNKMNGPVRRFSEMNISLKKSSNGSATSWFSTQQHPMLFRRHTQKIFKHSKTARTLGLATLALAITWFPYWYHLIKSLKNKEESLDQKQSVSLYGFICIKLQMNSFYLNYVLNPIFYSFVNRRFRQNVQVLFKNMVRSFFGLFRCCCNYNGQKKENIPTKDDIFKV